MLPVEDAIVLVWPECKEPGQRPDGHVEPPAAERSAMRRLVKRAEQEGQHIAVRDHERQHPPREPELPQERARDGKRAEVAEDAQERRPVRARHERVEILARELVCGEPDEDIVTHVAESLHRPTAREKYDTLRTSHAGYFPVPEASWLSKAIVVPWRA